MERAPGDREGRHHAGARPQGHLERQILVSFQHRSLSPIPNLETFRDVYSLCVAYPEPLADRLYAETKKFLNDHVASLLEKVQIGGENSLLRNYYSAWSEYSQGVSYLHSLYLYLNQQHIKKQKLSDAEMIYGGAENAAGK